MRSQLLILSMLLATSAHAQINWVEVAKNDTKSRTFYINPDSVRISAKQRKIWVMTNYAKSEKGIQSTMAREEYDCENERSRALTISAYAGPMATGQVVLTDPSLGPWDDVAPGTVGAIKYAVVCQL